MSIFCKRNTHIVAGARAAWCRATLCGLIAVLVGAASAQAQQAGTSPVDGGQFLHEGKSYRVVDASTYLASESSGNAIAPMPMASMAMAGCDDCGGNCGGSCGGSCGSGRGCGGGGLFGLGLFDDRITNFSDDGCNYGFTDPCGCCEPFWYASIEAIYMDLDGGDDRDLGDFFKEGFDHEAAGRYTFGCVRDCVHGIEFSYTGLLQWESRGSISDPAFGINSRIDPIAPLTAADFSAFENASFQSEAYFAQYWTGEVNRTTFAGDMAKVLFGLRYIDYEEDFRFFSQNATEVGFVRSETTNKLLGAQFGLDLLYPVCRRGYTDFRGRFAGFLNSYETRFQAINDGTFVIRNFDDEIDIAGLIELGGGFRYRMGNWQFRVGGELWYFYNLVDAPSSFTRQLAESTGSSVDPDDFFMAGFTMGAQLTY